MDTTTFHPDWDRLAAFDRGLLRAAEWAEVEGHLRACDACCRKLEAAPEDPFVAKVREAGRSGTPAPSRPVSAAVFGDAPTAGLAAPPGREVPPELAHHPRYRVLEFLGAGGMGVVFKAEHRLMERLVALKVINPRLTARPEMVERFRQEVRAAARLAHPNIAAAYDAEQAGDVHFLVTEFVEGVSLDKLVAQKGPLPAASACEYVRQAALGLQHAFERGMVHRDLKPANLMLTPSGRVKVLDFGLARLADAGRPAGALTQVGEVVGTPDYMAPEQALDSRRADVRADVYGLGCTLYHLLAGRPPFPEGTAFEKLLAHQDREPQPLTDLRPDLPAGLVAVVGRMLAKDPAERYPTPAAVAGALAPFCPSTPAPAEIVPPAAAAARRPRRWPLVAAAAGALAVLALAIIIVIEISTPKARVRIEIGDRPAPPADGKKADRGQVEAPRPQPAPAAVPKVPAPQLVNARNEVPLEEPFDQVRTGGAGRYLVFHLKKAHKLAVFDVSKVKVVRDIPLAEDDVLYAAGLDKLVVVLRGLKQVQRYDLTTFRREKMVPLPDDLPVRIALLGANSRGPLLLWGSGPVRLWDLRRLEPLAVKGKLLGGDPTYWFNVRGSADGQAFVGWHGAISGQQYNLMRLDGNQVTGFTSPDAHSFAGHWAQPNADASLVFCLGPGIYSGDMKVLSAEAFKGSALLPTEDPRFFLALRPQGQDKTRADICTSADRRPVFTVKDLEKLPGTVLYPNWGWWDGEPAVHYLPSARVLLTLPAGNDRVVVRHFDLIEALDRSGEDYLFVASQPRTSVPTGTRYEYRMDVKSRAGGLTYELTTAPKGMTVSRDGVLRWQVPPRLDGTEVKVAVTVRDRKDKEVIHSFQIYVEPNREKR